MLFLINKAQQELDAAPPRRIQNNLQQTNRKLDQTSQSVRSVQAGLGTLGQDLSSAKGKIPQNPAQALAKLGMDLQAVQTQMSAIQGQIPRGTEQAITKINSDLAAISGQLGSVVSQGLVTSKVQSTLTSKLSDLFIAHEQLAAKSVTTDSELASVDHVQRQLLDQTSDLVRDIKQLTSTINYKVRNLETRFMVETVRCDLQAKGLCGNLHLVVDAAEDVSAALLNAAAVGTFVKEMVAQFTAQETVDGETVDQVHSWSSFEPVVTPGNTGCWDATVTWSDIPADDPRFTSGNCRLTVTFDTDAGSTKIYVEGDTVTVTIQAASDDKFLGYTVTQTVKTYNVIA
jgi:hypothetical protein